MLSNQTGLTSQLDTMEEPLALSSTEPQLPGQRDKSLKMESRESGVSARDLILNWRWEQLLEKEMSLEHQLKLTMLKITSLVTPCLTTGVQEIFKSGSTFLLDLFWPRTSLPPSLHGLLHPKPLPHSNVPYQLRTLNSCHICRTPICHPTTSTSRCPSKPQPWETLGT